MAYRNSRTRGRGGQKMLSCLEKIVISPKFNTVNRLVLIPSVVEPVRL